MMRKGKRATAHWAAAALLACCLAQTLDCYRLEEAEVQEAGKEADAVQTLGVQEGKIVFGRVFEDGSGMESQVLNRTKKFSSNASAEDGAAYQADSPDWSKEQWQDMVSKEASWRRMVSSLQCGGNHLKFRTVGPGASQFQVEQGNAPPIPLSRVPSSCGYSMLCNSLALVMLVPYDGCNVVQEDGSYVLPMLWQGIPVSLWCPKTAAHIPLTPSPPAHHPHFPPQLPFTPYSQYPTPKPTSMTHTKRTRVPVTASLLEDHPHFPPRVPLPFTQYPLFPPYPQYPTPKPTRTTHSPLTQPLPAHYPYFPQYPFFPLQYPTPKPTETHIPRTQHPHFPFTPYPLPEV